MSRLLVDAHALLWWLADDPGLSDAAREAIADPASEPLVSAASIWEIAIRRSPVVTRDERFAGYGIDVRWT